MCEVEAEELEVIKDQAFLEGVIGTLTNVKFLIDQEKDPKVAVQKLREAIDNNGKEAVNVLSTICLNKLAKMLGPLKP